jgi:SAM-dependent methyltransferase
MTSAPRARTWQAGDVLGTQYLNGFVLVPTLQVLGKRGVLDELLAGPRAPQRLYATATGGEKGTDSRIGGLLGAVRTLALRGWLTQVGGPAYQDLGEVVLTATGARVVRAWARVRDDLDSVMTMLARLGPMLADPLTPIDRQTARVLQRVVGCIEHRWGYAADDDPREAPPGWLQHLDGTVACPVLVRNARRLEIGAGPDPVLMPALRALGHLDESGGVTRTGAEQAALAANLGVAVSYVETMANLDAVIFAGMSRNSRADDHVLRDVNIWGSAHNSAIAALRSELLRNVLIPIFDDPDLDAQPRGIADTGCGSGEALAAAIEMVLARTLRGRHLRSHPLYAVGADISPAACERARATLDKRCGHDGVRTQVLIADLAAPAAFDAELQEACGVGLADLLHTQMFLLHDREIADLDAVRAADTLDTAGRACRGEALEDMLTRLGGTRSSTPAAFFSTAHTLAGQFIPPAVTAADLVRLVTRWVPYLRHGLLLIEAHVPRPDASGAGRSSIDPAPAVWGVHVASGQFLMPYLEHELALVLAGLAPAYSAATGTQGVSAAHWVFVDQVYETVGLPDFDFSEGPGSSGGVE